MLGHNEGKMKTIKHLVMIVVFLILNFTNLFPEDLSIKKQIIIAYDYSGSVLKQQKNVQKANIYLKKILFSDSFKSKNSDHLINNLQVRGFQTPLFNNEDMITFFSFGINKEGIYEATSKFVENQEFIRRFSKKLIHYHGEYPNNRKISANILLEKYLPKNNTRKYNYTLSRYILPLVLNRIQKKYAKNFLVIIISDYRYGDSLSNIGDIDVIKSFAPNYFEKINESETNFFNFYATQELLTLNIGGVKGIVLKIVEIIPRYLLSIDFNEEDVFSLNQINSKKFSIPELNLNIKNTSDVFSIDSQSINISFPSNDIQYGYPVGITGGNLFLGKLITEIIHIPAENIPEKDKTVSVKINIKGIYNSKSNWGGKLPLLIQSNPRLISINRLNKGLPLVIKIIILIL